MKTRTVILALLLIGAVQAMAQTADYSKLSRYVRMALTDHRATLRRAPCDDRRQLCALVSMRDADTAPLTENGCRVLASFGRLHVVSIPLRALPALSVHHAVERIEAGAPHSIAMDTTVSVVRATEAHAGVKLPQAFTGQGVVVGVQDIGFDLTHPNFYDTALTGSRIRCFWDQLSADTLGSDLYVGADYRTEAAIQAYAHSRDGLIQTHGTHTLGSAAGTGYDTPYRGIAYESDICLVSNAVSSDLVLVDSADVYKYTYATDVLGFKYIFDYAAQRGMPCVVSFSEGSYQDFRGDDVLFYAAIDSLMGPGRILVASAGNEGQQNNYACKPAGMESARIRLLASGRTGGLTTRSRDPFTLTLQLYHADNTYTGYPLSAQTVYACADSLLTDTLLVDSIPYYITAQAYPSCYDSAETVLEVYVQTEGQLGIKRWVVAQVEGQNAEVHCHRCAGYISPLTSGIADNSHSVHSPGSAPSVICVGATGYRTGFRNYLGDYVTYDQGNDGRVSPYSSVGPTFDGRVKPDVVAPGTNVISSYSSYYLENNPEANDIKSDVAHFTFNGRTYAWNANSGTSMSTPVVAGVIALWLQAKPTLTTQDVLGVLSRTCRHYDPSLTYPNNSYGYGEIDAYRGLFDVLGLDRIEALSPTPSATLRAAFSREGQLELRFDRPLARTARLRLYSVTGQLLHQCALPHGTDTFLLPMPRLAAGVYALQVDSSESSVAGSTLVRLSARR